MNEEKGIVFLTNFYYPIPLANGVCVHAVAKELAKKGKTVFVVCLRRSREDRRAIIDGVNIIRIEMPVYQKLLFFVDSHKAKWYSQPLAFLGKSLSRIKKTLHLREYPLRDNCTVKRYVKATNELIHRSMVCKLVGVYTPLEAIKAGAIIKKNNPSIVTYYYSLDTLSNEEGAGLLSRRFRSRIGFAQESKYFEIYDKLIIMNCHKEHYSTLYFSNYKDKIQIADFPLFERRIPNDEVCEENRISFIGSLYKTIRNPERAFKLMERELDRLYLHFYGYSDCKDIIEKYSVLYPGHIIDHGLVSHEEAIDAMYKSSFLLSIGNHNTEMVPSKVFEYASTGKPIIHVYSDENDSCLSILKKYGNALCIREITEETYKRLHSFLTSRKSVDYQVLKNAFYYSTPEFSAKIFDN